MKKTFKHLPIKLKQTLLILLVGGISAMPVSKTSAQAIVASPGTSAITPVTQPVEQGPVLDVVPYVLADGYTINLALIPADTEFTGYAASPSIPQVTGNLNVVQIPTVLPTFTVRQVVATVNVWDNQTVVLGGLVTSSVQSTKNKIPVLGDLPLFGRFFQSESKTTQKDNLMIFVTATIVDPAGARVHSDDELPFAQNSVPAQAGLTPPVENVQNVRGLPGQNP
jgi:general secretion pathway protein D